MEFSEYNWATISETICREMLIFGKRKLEKKLFSCWICNKIVKGGGASHGALVLLHLPLLGFASFLLLLFFCVLYYKFILNITRGVPNKAVEKKIHLTKVPEMFVNCKQNAY